MSQEIDSWITGPVCNPLISPFKIITHWMEGCFHFLWPLSIKSKRCKHQTQPRRHNRMTNRQAWEESVRPCLRVRFKFIKCKPNIHSNTFYVCPFVFISPLESRIYRSKQTKRMSNSPWPQPSQQNLFKTAWGLKVKLSASWPQREDRARERSA